ncbi:MAG: hypothetical protein AVDCRST_MAG37-3583 [uncultured Rubrobacteraceae bacterium]|uniref:Uncharacterized protein n=1 Tax=uncultured Rubrobacteraceae bacterium TaxID=349277 RepID=A0A6J4R2T3_9ACTN|nr:MAG: hypothetical protein AVDCRST_MAG37-3583 [uncultured Rubrobacteraceae bacterium]
MNGDRFFEKAARLDGAIEGDPQATIDTVVQLLEDHSLRAYFFGRLDKPEWLGPLRERGFFDSPPGPVVADGTVRFPPWPEGGYLARVAVSATEPVLEIALSMPETANVRVQEDLANIALALPPRLSARLVPKATSWLEMLDAPSRTIVPNTLGDLLAHLTGGGEIDAALDLARNLLALRAEDRSIGDLTFTDPRPRFDVWDYQQILKENMPNLVSSARERTLSLLCDVLEDAARISRCGHDFDESESRPYWDGFHVQRPAIEDHRQNEPYGLIDALVTATRDAAEQLIAEGEASVWSLVGMLDRRGWQIFDRLALHLLWRFPEAAPDLVAERLTDRRRFDDPGSRHEYDLLAWRCFAVLDPADKRTILGWIDEGPDLERWRSWREAFEEEAPTEEEELRYVDRWRRDRLTPLGDDLPEDWRLRYEALVRKLGEAEHPEFASPGVVWVGPTSPAASEDLHSMSIEELFSYLRSWKSSGDFMSHSYEGLGRELTGVIASEPGPFAASSSGFRGLDPTYVRAFFNGLRDATKQGLAFEWSPVLNLSRWVLDQPREVRGRRPEDEAHVARHNLDPDWGWTRKAIAGLLSEGFGTETESRLPYGLRLRAWDVLAPLTEDEEPTPEYEARYGGSNLDPATLSINTTRGEAMHAVVRYATWVREEKEATGEGESVVRWLEEVPEAREVLDRHLEPRVEPSAAVRAVYGWWFPQLAWLDERWVASSVERIFPTEPEQRTLRAAAWGAFLAFTRPHPETFEVLRDEYRRSVELLSSSPSGRWISAKPDERLAEHLMTFYWWGILGLEQRDALLSQFFANAAGELRGRALSFVGLSLHRMGEDVPPNTLARLRQLWNRRLHPHAGEAPLSNKEAAAFGWWFASAKFDDPWLVEQLKLVLPRAHNVDAYDLVLERLASLAASMPADVVDCLRLLLEGDTEGWRIVAFQGVQRRILSAALRSGDPKARKIAEEVINRLGARGQWDLGKLLREAENGATY